MDREEPFPRARVNSQGCLIGPVGVMCLSEPITGLGDRTFPLAQTLYIHFEYLNGAKIWHWGYQVLSCAPGE